MGASPKQDRGGVDGDSVGDRWRFEGGQGAPDGLWQGWWAPLPSDPHLPEVPRAKVAASLIVSFGGNAALYSFREPVCALC